MYLLWIRHFVCADLKQQHECRAAQTRIRRMADPASSHSYNRRFFSRNFWSVCHTVEQTKYKRQNYVVFEINLYESTEEVLQLTF